MASTRQPRLLQPFTVNLFPTLSPIFHTILWIGKRIKNIYKYNYFYRRVWDFSFNKKLLHNICFLYVMELAFS